jgi:hypothetical protein
MYIPAEIQRALADAKIRDQQRDRTPLRRALFETAAVPREPRGDGRPSAVPVHRRAEGLLRRA